MSGTSVRSSASSLCPRPVRQQPVFAISLCGTDKRYLATRSLLPGTDSAYAPTRRVAYCTCFVTWGDAAWYKLPAPYAMSGTEIGYEMG
eukprot:964763-Rhodomonas_salina.1